MKNLFKVAVCITIALGVSRLAGAQTEVTIEYPYTSTFKKTHEAIIGEFEKKHPEIKVKVRATYENYEDGTQKVLRQSMTNTLPDITFQALNRFRIFVDRGIAQPLDNFIASEKNFSTKGFHEGMFSSGMFDGKVYALPFAISLPIAYYNMNLAEKAGYTKENLPETWEEVYTYASKIDALGSATYGMYFSYGITGNWFWQALNFSQGGAMLTDDEKKVAFDGTIGRWSINTLANMVTKGKQPNRSPKAAEIDFVTGNTGVYFESTAGLAKFTDSIGGKFELVTHKFPSVKKKGKLPAGGNGPMIVTKNPKKQKAAWEVIKFWCGPEGSEIVARTTGYMPPNLLAVARLKKKKFYEQNPNNLTAVQSLPHMTAWYAFPGANGLKITDVIFEGMESVATGKAKNAEAILRKMSKKVQRLLPR